MNELYMYAMIFENRMYRVALDDCDLTMISNGSRFAKMVEGATFVVDLQTNRIKHHSVQLNNVESISTSNPLYHIFVNLPLITFKDLTSREPTLYL